MPLSKAKPPIYPRPVSPISAEPIPFWPGEHIYESGNSEEDDTDQGPSRLAKRRRIEKLGEQYLRGQPLTIMSAILRGPLVEWKNPWTKRRPKARKRRREEEVPETRKIRRYLEPEVLETRNHQSHQSRPQIPEAEFLEVPQPLAATTASLKPTDKVDDFGNSTQDVKVRRVEDWLRTNDTFGNRPSANQSSSPTPVNPDVTQAEAEKQPNPAPPAGPTAVPVGDPLNDFLGAQAAPDLQPAANRKDETSLPAGGTVTARKPSSKKPNKPIQNLPNPPRVNGHISSNRLDDSRAEFAIMKAKQRLIRTLPASTNLSPFEYRKTTEKHLQDQTKASKYSSEHEIIIEDINKHQNHKRLAEERPQFHQPDVSNLDDGLARAGATDRSIIASESALDQPVDTSNPDTFNVLPSAQIVGTEQFDLPRLVASTAEKLHELENTSAIGKEARHASKPTRDTNEESLQQTAAPYPAEVQHEVLTVASSFESLDIEPAISPIPEAPSSPIAANLNTQEMLAAMSPVVLSTIKKPNRGIDLKTKNTPLTATKSKSRTLQKQSKVIGKSPKCHPPVISEPISVSSGSNTSQSQGSIKSALKVAKPTKGPETKKVGPEENVVVTPGIHRNKGEKDTNGINFSVLHHEPESAEHFCTPQATPTRTKELSEHGIEHAQQNTSTIKISKTQQSTAPTTTTMTTNPPPPSHQPSAPIPSTDSISHGGQERMKAPLATKSQDNVPSHIFIDGIKGLEEHDTNDIDFNLDAAIDDLGSYLGTWDAEKEASFL